MVVEHDMQVPVKVVKHIFTFKYVDLIGYWSKPE